MHNSNGQNRPNGCRFNYRAECIYVIQTRLLVITLGNKASLKPVSGTIRWCFTWKIHLHPTGFEEAEQGTNSQVSCCIKAVSSEHMASHHCGLERTWVTLDGSMVLERGCLATRLSCLGLKILFMYLMIIGWTWDSDATGVESLV